MRMFQCYLCGFSSLVRSNFKGTPDGKFYCNSTTCRKSKDADNNRAGNNAPNASDGARASVADLDKLQP